MLSPDDGMRWRKVVILLIDLSMPRHCGMTMFHLSFDLNFCYNIHLLSYCILLSHITYTTSTQDTRYTSHLYVAQIRVNPSEKYQSTENNATTTTFEWRGREQLAARRMHNRKTTTGY